MVLKTLDIWQHRTVIPERRDKHEISSITAPAYFLKAVAEGKETWEESDGLPELRRW